MADTESKNWIWTGGQYVPIAAVAWTCTVGQLESSAGRIARTVSGDENKDSEVLSAAKKEVEQIENDIIERMDQLNKLRVRRQEIVRGLYKSGWRIVDISRGFGGPYTTQWVQRQVRGDVKIYGRAGVAGSGHATGNQTRAAGIERGRRAR